MQTKILPWVVVCLLFKYYTTRKVMNTLKRIYKYRLIFIAKDFLHNSIVTTTKYLFDLLIQFAEMPIK